MYRTDTSNGDLQQTGDPTLPPPQQPSYLTRSSSCTPRAVITAVLAGSAASLIAILASNHSLLAALLSGAFVALAAVGVLMRFQYSAMKQAVSAPLIADDESADRTVLAENEQGATTRAGTQPGHTNE